MASWLGWNATEKEAVCSPCLALSHLNLASLSSVVSAASLSLIRCKIWCLFQWHSQLLTFWFVLKGTHLLQSGVFISSSFSCQAFTLTGSHLFHWQSEDSVCFYLSPPTFYCSSVSAGVARSLLLSAVWVRHEAGSLPPSVFYTTVSACILGGYSRSSCLFRCRCQHKSISCTISWHTPTVLPG